MRGKRLIRGGLLGALAVAALAAAGCAGEAVRFNNSIVDYNKRLAAAGKRLGETLAPALQGGQVNAADVKGAYNEVLNTLDQVKKEFASLKVPSGASAKKLADAYGKFLQGQEDMVRNQMGQLVKMAESGKPAPGQMMGLLQAIGAREQADLVNVQAAQREFARDHNIRLIESK